MPEKPPKASLAQDLLKFQKTIYKFLKEIAKLPKTDPHYQKFRGKAKVLREMYFEIDGLELKETAVPVATVGKAEGSQPKAGLGGKAEGSSKAGLGGKAEGSSKAGLGGKAEGSSKAGLGGKAEGSSKAGLGGKAEGSSKAGLGDKAEGSSKAGLGDKAEGSSKAGLGGKAAEGSSKADCKNRREERKQTGEAERKKRRAKRAVETLKRKEQKGDKSGNKEESIYRFDKLKAVWDNIKFDEITSDFRKYLDIAEKFLTDAKIYISFVETYAKGSFDKEIEEVKGYIEKIERFLVIARNASKQVDHYTKIATDIVKVITTLPRKVEDLTDGIVEEATRIFAAAKNFIAVADIADPKTANNVEKLKGYLEQGQNKLSELEQLVGMVFEDKDKDNLPDWYNRLEEKYNAIFGDGKDLIAGTKIDDKVLLKINGFKALVDKFVAEASAKIKEGTSELVKDLKEKLANAQQWLEQIGEIRSRVTGFVEHVKEGDLENIYKDLVDLRTSINSDKDLFTGTKIDDGIKKTLQEHSKKAEKWLMNKLTGGDAKKEQEVREILGEIHDLILGSGGVVDHSSKYGKQEKQITIPDIKDVSQKQVDEVLERYGIRDTNSSYEGILSDMKDQADTMKAQTLAKYKESMQHGAKASEVFRDAKKDYDSAVKSHNINFNATNNLGKRIINGLLGVAGRSIDSFLPGAGTVIEALGKALLGDFKAINKKIDDITPDGLDIFSDLAKGIVAEAIPQLGSERGIIEMQGGELMKGLDDVYHNGVTAHYEEVATLIDTIKGYARALGKNLRTVEQAAQIDQAALTDVKKKVIILELKWKGLQKSIKDKYINLSYPKVNEEKAYHYASRYLYSVWLIKFPVKEIRIGNSLIKKFGDFDILKEANVEWNTGFFAKLGRGLFGFLNTDPGGYRDKVKALKQWANKENDRLKSAEVWKAAFK